MKQLLEDSKNKIISQAKSGEKYKDKPGENRYSRRVKSKISTSTATYNKIDMTKFFNQDILDVGVPVKGETDDYIVMISFPGILEFIQREIQINQPLDYSLVMKAIKNAFNRENVHIKCNCKDWQYRIGYWATQKDIQFIPTKGKGENRASKITNPNDSLGHACKHACLVLSQQSWVSKVARTIVNYVKYMENHMPNKYKEIIFPRIYNMPYSEAQLKSDEETINQSNEEGRKRGQFKKGNTEGVRFAKKQPSEEEDNKEINNAESSESSGNTM